MKRSDQIAFFRFLLLCFSVVFVFVICGNAAGQDDADDSEFTLEEIVVTAEFREKAIQDTPLSITAVSADMLEVRSQVSIEQIALQSPGVTLKPNNASTVVKHEHQLGDVE